MHDLRDHATPSGSVGGVGGRFRRPHPRDRAAVDAGTSAAEIVDLLLGFFR